MRTAQLQRVNVLWFCTLGITALAAGILVYILLLESALGAFSIREASPVLFGDRNRPQVLIHSGKASSSKYSELYSTDSTGALYDSTVAAWRDILDRRLDPDRPSVVLDDAALATGSFGSEDLLVLPASLVLDEDQIFRITTFLENGGSLLISRGAGLFDQTGDRKGWEFMERNFGVQFETFVQKGPENFRTSTLTYSASVPEGIYVPRYRQAAMGEERSASRSARENALRQERVRRAEESDFAPLREYVWYDTLGANPPRFDYASVRHPINPADSSVVGDSVSVLYFTWVGTESTQRTPYPRTDGTTRRFTLRANTPLTSGVPGGYRVKIQVYSPGVNMRITDVENTFSAGFWHDFATDDRIDQRILQPSSGLVYGKRGAGRFVIMGFGPSALGAATGDPEDEKVLARLYDNVLSYLRREPTVWTHDWPAGYDAAVILAPDLTSSAVGVSEMIEFFDREGLPGTFFVSEEFARRTPALVQRLVDRGNVGLLDILGGPDASWSNRAVRISTLRDMLSGVTGQPVLGYRSDLPGQPSPATLAAISSEGFSYFLPDSIGRRTTPKILGSPYEVLTRIGVSTQDPAASVVQDPDLTAKDIEERLLAEAYRVLDEGGLYHISPRAALFGAESEREIFRSFVGRLRRENVWFASGDEVARWWRLRKGLNADVEQRSPSRIFVRVSNDNGDTAEHATVSISLGRAVSSVNIKPELINILKQTEDDIAVPPYRLIEDGTVLELTIKELKPQQYRIFHIDLFSPALSARFASN